MGRRFSVGKRSRHWSRVGTILLFDFFISDLIGALGKAAKIDGKFAYYTSAETATKIIQNEEVWLRSATVMNDYSEITHGLSLLKETMSSAVGNRFYSQLESVHNGIKADIERELSQLAPQWLSETYLACLSRHDPKEDKTGRLSMWRAYGDVALVIDHTPLTSVSDNFGFFSMPVQYLDHNGINQWLQRELEGNSTSTVVASLCQLERDALVERVVELFFVMAVGIKHFGFSEEKEWRIVFRPTGYEDALLTRRIEIVRGVPQPMWALPLRHDPENNLYRADIPSLLDRIIIGPTSYPHATAIAFRQLLKDAGVEDFDQKVVESDIPLRGLA